MTTNLRMSDNLRHTLKCKSEKHIKIEKTLFLKGIPEKTVFSCFLKMIVLYQKCHIADFGVITRRYCVMNALLSMCLDHRKPL